jgi:hypothetical protein
MKRFTRAEVRSYFGFSSSSFVLLLVLDSPARTKDDEDEYAPVEGLLH